MTLPSNEVTVQGLGAETADTLNTKIQWTSNLTSLRAFVGASGMMVYLQGLSTPNDGGQGIFYWNATAPGPDDGVNVIVPNGVTVGAWVRDDATGTGVRAIVYVIDGGGLTPSAGVKGQLSIPFACSIQSVTLLADQPGSAVVDIWKIAYSGFNLPAAPTVSNSICASDLPTLASAVKAQDTTLTGWTTSISANDTLTYNLQSAATITRLTITLKVS